MANYSIATTSKFHPFSYQELLAPALLATQAHQALEEAYGDLNLQASIWEGLTEGSPKAREQYRKFAEDLAAEAESLSKQGLTPTSKQAMLNMRGRFGKEITPIEQAYKKREAQAEAQQKALLNNPSLLFNRKAAETNLDKYLENPSLDYNVYSGALLEKQVSDAASALAKAARNDPNVQKTLMRKLLPYQYETIRQSGFDPDTVRATIMGTQGGSEILAGIVNDTLTASGIEDWKFASPVDKEQVLREARAWANRGLWSSVGETKYGNLTDEYGMKTALNVQEFNNAVKLAREKNGNSDGKGNPAYRRIANTQVLGNTEQLKKDLEFLNSLTGKGMDQFSKEKKTMKIEPGSATARYHSPGAIGAPSEYDIAKSRYKTIAARYGLNGNSWGPNANKALIDRVTKEIKQNVTRSQTYQMNMTDQSLLTQILGENSNTFSIENRNRTGFKEIDSKGRLGKELTSSEAGEMLSKGTNHNLSYRPDKGFQLSYIDSENNYKTVTIDPELLNFGDKDYSAADAFIKKYMEAGDYDNANSLMGDMMTGLYYRFNTLRPKQSTSSSDIE